GAGGFVFGPGAVGILGADEVLDATLNAWAMGVVERAEAHDCPGGLGSSARSLAFKNGVVVGVAAFAPAAVFVLNAFEPIACFKDPGLVHIDVQGAQAAQDLPGAVDVIDTPAAIP